MKRKIFLSIIIYSLFLINCKSGNPGYNDMKSVAEGTVVQLTNETFKKFIFDYDSNKEWKYEGTKPAIIDFYADWCPPCRELSPLVEEVAREYAGKIVVYKVNTDQQKLVAQKLGITGLPSLLFIPAKGSPQMSVGYIPKESIVKGVNEFLLIK